MTYFLIFVVSIFPAFLGWFLGVFGKENGIYVLPWQIAFFVVAVILIIVGIVGGIHELKMRRGLREEEELRRSITTGKKKTGKTYPPLDIGYPPQQKQPPRGKTKIKK